MKLERNWSEMEMNLEWVCEKQKKSEFITQQRCVNLRKRKADYLKIVQLTTVYQNPRPPIFKKIISKKQTKKTTNWDIFLKDKYVNL